MSSCLSVLLGLLCVAPALGGTLLGSPSSAPLKVSSVTFLLTVNDTWYPDEYHKKCLMTVKTPPLRPDMKWNETVRIKVGECDNGPLTYTITDEGNGKSYITPTFYSSVIEDAAPPSCKIQWDYSYKEPKTENPKESLLPGCFVMDSREGWYLTYYWINVLDWAFEQI